MDKLSKTISTIYALILIAGGFMGYIKAGSEISLIAGTFCGLTILWTGITTVTSIRFAYLYIISVSLLLALSFSVRLAVSDSFFPTGLMLILSTAVYVIIGRRWVKVKDQFE